MTTQDPRERIIQLGNELLDTIYDSELLDRENSALIEAGRKGDDAAIKAAAARIPLTELAEFLIRRLELDNRRASLTDHYILLRETIEHLDTRTTR